MVRASAKALIVGVLILIGLLALSPGPGRVSAAPAVPGQVIVQFAPGTAMGMLRAAAATGAALESPLEAAHNRSSVSYALYSSDTLSAVELAERLKALPGVVAVSPNYRRSVASLPNDPRFDELWGLDNHGQVPGVTGADIDAPAAWQVTQGAGTVVACLDTGVDYTHPDLAANMWRNPGEIPGDGIDNDGNGYIDDVYGMDAYSGDSDPRDENGHGTHVAGTMAATGDNGIGVVGVAWRAQVMALRFLGPDGQGTDADAIACINYAIDMKVNHGVNIVAINASWGGADADPVLRNAIDAAGSVGIAFVAAAGNQGLDNDAVPYYPASYTSSNIIAVGASDSYDSRASFSNYAAAGVDLFAPGDSILSTHVRGAYDYRSGTSMAAPHVTGAIALVASLHPEDSLATRMDRVLLSVDHPPSLAGRCRTGGRLNAASAALTACPVVTSLTPAAGPVAGGNTVIISGSGFLGLSGAAAVTFGGVAAGSYVVDSDTRITAVAPAHSPGCVRVRVFTVFGESVDTAADDYSYFALPVVTSVSPTAGPLAGGGSVTISGAAFTNATRVTFGSEPASAFHVDSDTRIIATAPAHSPGGVSIQVTTLGGTSPDTPADDYTYAPAPVVEKVRPTCDLTSGGATVAISGTALSAATQVLFGEQRAEFHVDSAGQITAVAPAHAPATVSVRVVSPGGMSPDTEADDFIYEVVSTPVVMAVFPHLGPTAGGTNVVISGQGFTGATSVTFGGVESPVFTVDSPTQITATAPAHTGGLASVVVKGPGGVSADAPVDDYFYLDAPTVSNLSSSSGPSAGGTTVVIRGTGFIGLSGASAVTFGGVAAAAYTVDSPTQITAVSPSHLAATVRVQVTTAGGTTAAVPAADYTFQSPALHVYEQDDPLIGYAGSWADFFTTSASKGAYARASTGTALASICFDGDRLDWKAMKGKTTGRADVYLDGEFQATIDLAASIAAYQVHVWSTGLLHPGRHNVTISWNPSNPPGKFITLDSLEVLGTLAPVRPVITALTPRVGDVMGGATVTISGLGFIGLSGPSAVTFGEMPAAAYTVLSPTRITAVTPAHAPGAVPVQVTAAGGISADGAGLDFTYFEAPPTTRIDATTTNPAFVRSGDWAYYRTASAYEGSYLRSSTPGAYVVIPFVGTRLDLIATKGTTTGKADVYLDNVFQTTVDLSAPVVAYRQQIWSSGPLVSGYHTVKLMRSPSSQKGRFVTLDAVDVAGALLTTTRKEQTEPLLLWTPGYSSWNTGITPSASGGSYAYINKNGASLVVNFRGVGLNLVAKKASSYGKIRVTLDNAATSTVDLYSSRNLYQQTVWRSGFLAPGDHTVKIERLGTKNRSSSGYTVNLDGLDLIGELR